MVSSKGLSSPRPWGCFQVARRGTEDCPVFPTPVGVFPLTPTLSHGRHRLPHARGGVSKIDRFGDLESRSSPRPWGCFRHQVRHAPGEEVFPTPVGVFPPSRAMLELMACLPHARGGVSDELARAKIEARSSPRPWGCFLPRVHTSTGSAVFPTPVGVFPRSCRGCRCHGGLPHARGGVSVITQRRRRWLGSSPRPWGCFQQHEGDCGASWVFPTPVGVFPGGQCCLMLIRGLPHARGGVSNADDAKASADTSSPRPWGCFRRATHTHQGGAVFPTPVGVFPRALSSAMPVPCLPHARGGVSKIINGGFAIIQSSPHPWARHLTRRPLEALIAMVTGKSIPGNQPRQPMSE